MDYVDVMKVVVIGKSSGCDFCSCLEKFVEELNKLIFWDNKV